jgi:hypothetical protein
MRLPAPVNAKAQSRFALLNLRHVDAVPASGAVAGDLAIPSSESEWTLPQIGADANLAEALSWSEG